jgi:tRNA(Ile)-lysidine synthase
MFVAEVQACIDAYGMLHSGAKVIVAVSGGPDSMALLSALYQLRQRCSLTLAVAHVNHQLRGEEARRDAAFVERQAMRFGLPLYQTQVDVKAFQRTSGLSPQHAARQLRYAFLSSLQPKMDATHIALGHTADDQAETLLIRLLRGGGLAGLAGIPAIRPPFVRPLIAMSRHAILAYLRAEGIPWVTDSSNAHRTYLRNRIRLDLLPTLQEYNPQVIKRLNELADMLRADNVVLEEQTDALVKRAVHWPSRKKAMIQSDTYNAAPLALQRRLLRRLVDILRPSAHTASFQHVEALRQLIHAGTVGKRLTLPGRLIAERHVDTVLLWNAQETPATTHSCMLTIPGSVALPDLAICLHAEVIDALSSFDGVGPGQAHLDLEQSGLSLTVRFPRSGDCFHPLGAPGYKKLNDFFIDKGIVLQNPSRYDRKRSELCGFDVNQ